MARVLVVHDGRRLRLGVGPDRRVWCASAAADCDAVFDRAELGHGRVALRTNDGRYLAVRPDSGLNYGLYPAAGLSACAAFEEIRWPDGAVSLRSCHLAYVSADPAGLVTVNRAEAGPWECFTIAPATALALPGQRSPTRPAVAPTPHR